MWWVAVATVLLVLLTLVIHRIHRWTAGLSLTEGPVPVPVLVADVEAVGLAFRDLDEQAREVSRRLLPP